MTFLSYFQNPDHIPIALLNGHNASISGTYMYALGKILDLNIDFGTMHSDGKIKIFYLQALA